MSPVGKPIGFNPATPAAAAAAAAAVHLSKVEELDETDGLRVARVAPRGSLHPPSVRGSNHLQLMLQVARSGQAHSHLPVLKLPAELTINNNARLRQDQSLLPSQRRQVTAILNCRAPRPMSPPRSHQAARVAAWTFAEYLNNQKEPGPPSLLVSSRSNTAVRGGAGRHRTSNDDLSGQRLSGAEAAAGVQRPPSMFNRPQLSTFAEYQKRAQQAAAASKRGGPAYKHDEGSRGHAMAEATSPEEMDASAMGSDAAGVCDEGEEDAESAETRNKGGCCACCSRNRKEPLDTANRRKGRVVGPHGGAAGEANRIASLSLEDDAELADVKDMDPTIILMPYVLFESERAKVLYQSSSIEEVELLKRAINLHANDMYKKVLMRLHMYRYLHLFKEAIVRSLLSKKVLLGQDSALAANVLGIDISEDSKTASGASSSAALTVGTTFDSQPVEMMNSPNPATQSDVSRAMFKPAPKFTDNEILELLNSGKIIDVTGRASLESLVSLPTTKVGQRRSSKASD